VAAAKKANAKCGIQKYNLPLPSKSRITARSVACDPMHFFVKASHHKSRAHLMLSCTP
jgi:hypothetical protein